MLNELKPGSYVECHALVLSTLPLKEADKLVHLLTAEWGILTAVAVSAARSQKRFGPALETMNHIKAQLKVPRDPRSSESPLWRLKEAELKDSFLHMRKSYSLLESGFFVVRLVKDLVPEASSDPHIFKALGRFLRDSAGAEAHADWMRLAFWTWFTHHLGFGDLSEALKGSGRDFDKLFATPSFAELWHRSLVPKDVQFAPLFFALKEIKPLALTSEQEAKIYQKWVEVSGIHWNYFEQWLSSRQF